MAQPMGRKVTGQDNNIEGMNPHFEPPGYAVTKCGAPPPTVGTNHTLRTTAVPGDFLVKRITNAGTFRFKKRLLFISHALAPHTIGLEEIDNGVWSIHFCDVRDYIIRG
jgi:hypothetical protein